MTSSLPASIVSNQDLTMVIREIQDYVTWATHQTIKRRAGSKAPVGNAPELTAAATDLISAWGKSRGATADSYRQLVENLERIAKTAPSINITLAAPAPQTVKEHLVAWCRSNISQNVLVTFGFNHTLLGGMVVRAGSHIYDWSLRRKLIDNGGAFTEVLRRV